MKMGLLNVFCFIVSLPIWACHIVYRLFKYAIPMIACLGLWKFGCIERIKRFGLNTLNDIRHEICVKDGVEAYYEPIPY